eukprot:FR738241.1.p1 GENE.FR738241.1~~FR738241.1.p1  ORF type:complete len:121 (+),score=44.54 FR738241.1:806-1168(+)
MNPATPGEKGFWLWGALPLPQLLNPWRSGRSAAGKPVMFPFKGVKYGYLTKFRGKTPGKKIGNQKTPQKRPENREKRAGMWWGFFPKRVPPPPRKKISNKKYQDFNDLKMGGKIPQTGKL